MPVFPPTVIDPNGFGNDPAGCTPTGRGGTNAGDPLWALDVTELPAQEETSLRATNNFQIEEDDGSAPRADTVTGHMSVGSVMGPKAKGKQTANTDRVEPLAPNISGGSKFKVLDASHSGPKQETTCHCSLYEH